MRSKLPWMRFFPSDWLQDTRVLSLRARGAWIDLLCAMWIAPERGRLDWTVDMFINFLGCGDKDAAMAIFNELKTSGVGDLVIDDSGERITLISRRMTAERIKQRRAYERVAKLRKCNADVTLESRKCNADVTQCNANVTLMKRIEDNKKTSVEYEFTDEQLQCNADVTLESRKCNADVTLESRKCNADVTLQKSEVRSQKSYNNIYPPLVPQGDASEFDAFWKAYPRKVGKGAAQRIWLRIKPSEEIKQQIFAAIEKQKKSMQWQQECGRFIPYPATWLNQRRWEDGDDDQLEESYEEARARLDRIMEIAYGKQPNNQRYPQRSV